MECAGASDDDDEDAWEVRAEYATDQRSAMEPFEIANNIWNTAEEFMHQAGLYMQPGHIGKDNNLYLFVPVEESKVSCTYVCPHAFLCQCGAGIRITETKRKLILEFKEEQPQSAYHACPSLRAWRWWV